MMIPLGRHYQIDYLFGLRYLLSRVFRKQVHEMWEDSTWLRTLHVSGVVLSVLVVAAATSLLTIAIRDLVV